MSLRFESVSKTTRWSPGRIWGMLFLLLASSGVLAAVTPSAQQLQMFNSLSAAEKQQVMRALGGAAGGTIAVPRPGTDQSRQEETTTPGPTAASAARDEALAAELEAERKRFRAGDTLILYLRKLPEKTEHNLVVQDGKEDELPPPEGSIHRLDKNGLLDLPDVGKIQLAGLTEEEAAARILLEPIYQGYEVGVKRLPLIKSGRDALQPFGYDIFRQDAETPASLDVPVPSDYQVGPGDTINIQLFGKENQNYSLQVARDGTLAFPGMGFIPVAGMSFAELKSDIQDRVKRQFIGVEAHVTMGELRGIRVFVLGEVERPGAYTLSALSGITQALIQAGGVKTMGSLRNIQLKREGRRIVTLDAYDLLLRGDNRNDRVLKPGDVVYVPPVGATVAVYGEVKRPAIYELKKARTVREVIELAGGVLPTAYLDEVILERVEHRLQRQILQVDLKQRRTPRVKSGDVIRVDSVTQRLANVITVRGMTERAGWYQWHEGIRLTDIFKSAAVFKPNADLEYLLIKRYTEPGHRLTVLMGNLVRAWQQPDSDANLVLQPRDEILIFQLGDNRQRHIQPIIEQLTLQSSKEAPTPVVRVSGRVHAEGDYPLVPGMRVSDLIRAAGRLQESAYTLEAELTRYVTEDGKPRVLEHLRIPLDQVLAEHDDSDILLQPFDHLNIKAVPLWEQENFVELKGEVRFPGRYAISRGETLSQLLERAGGLTGFAYPQGAVFMREDLRRREQERMDAMAAKLEAELAALTLQRANSPAEAASGGIATDLLSKLRTVKAAGRLVIHLDEINAALTEGRPVDPDIDVILRDGDRLFVPAQMQEVTVIGEVYHPTSHLYAEELSVKDYINASGGMTNQAAKSNIYVIKADGTVNPAKKSWFSPMARVSPGDTIVVPYDSQRVSKLKLWSDISRITYQLGLSIAAWNSVGLLNF